MRRQEKKDFRGFNHFEANVILDSSQGRAKNKDFSHNRDKSRGRSKSKFKGKIICHYCNNPGHIEKFCRKKKKDKSKERKEKTETETSEQQQQQSYGKATSALAISSNDVCFIGEQGSLNLVCDDCNWVIDSGASYHLTSCSDYFSSYTSGDFGQVLMGHYGSSKIIGMGTMHLETLHDMLQLGSKKC